MKDSPTGVVVQSCVGAVTAWRYEKPQHNGKMNLLTIGGVAVHGSWYGEVGEYFLAWAPLLKRDKQKEREILASRPKLGHIRVSDHVKITVHVTPVQYCGHGSARCTYECFGKARGHCK